MDSFTQLPAKAGRGGGFAQLPAKTAGGGWEISPSFQPKQAGGGALPIRQQRMANAKRMHSKYPSFQQRQQACNSSRRGGEATIPATAHLAM